MQNWGTQTSMGKILMANWMDVDNGKKYELLITCIRFGIGIFPIEICVAHFCTIPHNSLCYCRKTTKNGQTKIDKGTVRVPPVTGTHHKLSSFCNSLQLSSPCRWGILALEASAHCELIQSWVRRDLPLGDIFFIVRTSSTITRRLQNWRSYRLNNYLPNPFANLTQN